MDFRRLVLVPGDVVTAWGVVVLDAEGVWFQPALPTRSAALYPHWAGAVPVIEASMDLVAGRREEGDLVHGMATITAQWDGQRLQVLEQVPQAPKPRLEPQSSHSTPPCQPPAEGWPIGAQQDLECDYGDLRKTGAVVSTAIFRPSADRVVLVVAAGDLAAVETSLRPQLGARLCVVPSRFTRSQIDAAMHLLADRFSVWAVYEFGEEVDDVGQPFVSAALTRMLPEVPGSLGTPPGLVALEPWLAPSR